MAVRAENHLAAAGVAFAHILMHDRLMRRKKDRTVLFRSAHRKQMIILVAGAVGITKRVMAAGEHERYRKFLHAAGNRRFQYTHVRHILTDERIKADLQPLHIARDVMRLQHAIGHRLLRRLLNLLPADRKGLQRSGFIRMNNRPPFK